MGKEFLLGLCLGWLLWAMPQSDIYRGFMYGLTGKEKYKRESQVRLDDRCPFPRIIPLYTGPMPDHTRQGEESQPGGSSHYPLTTD